MPSKAKPNGLQQHAPLQTAARGRKSAKFAPPTNARQMGSKTSRATARATPAQKSVFAASARPAGCSHAPEQPGVEPLGRFPGVSKTAGRKAGGFCGKTLCTARPPTPAEALLGVAYPSFCGGGSNPLICRGNSWRRRGLPGYPCGHAASRCPPPRSLPASPRPAGPRLSSCPARRHPHLHGPAGARTRPPAAPKMRAAPRRRLQHRRGA